MSPPTADGSTAGATKVVAAFDFDRTLTTRDTFVRFLTEVAGSPRAAGALIRHLGAVRRRDELKARMCLSLLRGRTDLRQQGRAYGDRVVRELLRPDMVARLQWHRAQGHEVAIVSASLDCYLETIARHLKVEHLLCTRLEHDDTWCTGRLVGPNCRGPEKLRRIREHFGADGYELWAYGDSAGDDDMLAAADHAHRVGRRTVQ